MDVVRNDSKEGEDFKNTEAAPLSRSESRGGDWKTQVSYNHYNASTLEISITNAMLFSSHCNNIRCKMYKLIRYKRTSPYIACNSA